MSKFFYFFFSLAIVALGQPSFFSWAGIVAAGLGYALFWRYASFYPLKKQRFWRAFFWFTSVSAIQLSWMTAIDYQGLYILGALAGLSALLGFQFAAITLFIPYNRAIGWPRLLALASCWTLLEWVRFHVVLCGFSWNPVGMALSQPYALQMAALFGIFGLSFWVMMVNMVALRAFVKQGVNNYLIWAGCAAFPYLFGAVYSFYHDAHTQGHRQLSCALVQTGLLPPQKLPLPVQFQAFISPYEQWRRILHLLRNRPNHPLDLVVLPEGVVPYTHDACNYSKRRVQQVFKDIFGPSVVAAFPLTHAEEVSNGFWSQTLSNYLGADVIIGLDHHEGPIAHNSAFRFRPSGETPNRYDKQILMPLAEYLPFEWLRPLVQNYGIDSFFTPGLKSVVFDGELPVAVSICYEETFPDPMREGRVMGAKLFVNLTNDAWYPFSRLPSQHFEHARIRAVENGVPLIRACNTGVTAAVDSLGRVTARLQEAPEEEGKLFAGTLFTTVDVYEHPTPYLLWGDWAILSISLFLLGCFLFAKLTPVLTRLYFFKKISI